MIYIMHHQEFKKQSLKILSNLKNNISYNIKRTSEIV